MFLYSFSNFLNVFNDTKILMQKYKFSEKTKKIGTEISNLIIIFELIYGRY